MRPPLNEFDGRSFDVVVIGAGVNGASAAQHLTAAGYAVLLVEKGDFASGSSSRSSRILHCGLRYLAPGASLWEFVRHPGQLAVALRMAKQAMEARAQIVGTAPERTSLTKCHFPIYSDGPYARWQAELGLRLLDALGPRELPLGRRMIGPKEAKETPLIRWLRDDHKLVAVAAYDEYQFEWPERLCLDAVLDAERMGAVVRNHTAVDRLARDGGAWTVTLSDKLIPGDGASVRAGVIVNTAGIWIDRVNQSANPKAGRKITGTKGVHIMVRLPPDCREYMVATLNRVNEPFYCLPWRGMHYFGPTETLYDGDLDDIRPLEDEIAFLIDEANYLLPPLSLKRSDVIFAWAGVRPLTYDPALPKGKRVRLVHDLGADGLPNAFALTAGPIMTHRSAGAELTRRVAKILPPSAKARRISYAARRFPDNQNAPPLLDDYTAITIADLKYAAEHEHPADLIDLLFRRVGAGWTATMAYGAAEKAARAVAEEMGWDAARVAEEARKYRDYLARMHLYRPDDPDA